MSSIVNGVKSHSTQPPQCRICLPFSLMLADLEAVVSHRGICFPSPNAYPFPLMSRQGSRGCPPRSYMSLNANESPVVKVVYIGI